MPSQREQNEIDAGYVQGPTTFEDRFVKRHRIIPVIESEQDENGNWVTKQIYPKPLRRDNQQPEQNIENADLGGPPNERLTTSGDNQKVKTMALRGRQPEAIKKRLKVLFFGQAGSGKTTAAIQFPKPYLIDTERGAENDEYVDILKKRGGVSFFTTDFDEMLQEVTSLLTEKHDYRTLIIDPLTVPYNDALDKQAKLLATKEDPSGTAFSRHKQVPDRKVKHLLNLLLRLVI